MTDFKYFATIETKSVLLELSANSSDPWYCSYTHSITSIEHSCNNRCNLVSIHNIEPDNIGYVVWVQYSTSDKFGCGDRNNIELLGLFADPHVSNQFALLLQQYNPLDPFNIHTHDGQQFLTPYYIHMNFTHQAHILISPVVVSKAT